jgi:tetratricopeptide (TPR) repeat protein
MGVARSAARRARRSLAAIGLAAWVVGSGAIAPATAEDVEATYRKCIYPDLARLDAVIGFCTTVIKSGRGGAPAQASAHLSRGNMYRRKGQYDRALDDYDESLRLDPANSAAILTSRGNAWRGKKDYARAITDHTAAIDADPNYAVAYNNRGNVWSDRGEWDKAVADYDKAIALDPKYANAFYNRGLAWQARDDRPRAIDDFRAAVKLQPGFAAAIDSLKELDVAP